MVKIAPVFLPRNGHLYDPMRSLSIANNDAAPPPINKALIRQGNICSADGRTEREVSRSKSDRHHRMAAFFQLPMEYLY
jgi:hypothetical protein